MSKFVTYGVTEMLDNDQKFIIDSDRTGPGSITAKDAASSLLSKWAGFETFEEAVQNTISNNQEFIDRDTAIRSETAELKKKIVTTFPAKDASGAVATFESEFEDAPLKSCIVQVEPVQDLHGYDSPWPAGGGVNKCPNVGWVQGQIQANGALSPYVFSISSDYILLDPGTYTLSRIYDNTPGAGAVAYHSYDMEKTYLSDSGWCPNPWTFYITESTYIRLTTRYNTSTDLHPSDIDGFVKIQLELGSTATAWTPYENICPISGWTGCEVQRTGKNLFDPNEYLLAGATKVEGEDAEGHADVYTGNKRSLYRLHGRVIEDPSATGLIPRLPYGRLTISFYKFFANNDQVWFHYTDAEAWVNHTGNTTAIGHRTYTSDANRVCDGVAIETTQGASASYKFGDLQIEVASAETEYVPYTGQTYPITFPSEAGTVYGGHIDPINGELVVDRAIVDLGTLTWDFYDDTHRAWTTNLRNLIKKPSSNSMVLGSIAEKYTELRANATLKAGEYAVLPDGALILYYDGANAPSGNLVYPLATPIHYHITATEIKTLLGTNNIWSNTGDTAVEYLMSDVSWYVEKKLRAFQSILAGVEDSTSASKNYSANTYLIFNNDIYRVTKAITTGETIEEGVNVTKTTVAEQLMALAQA